MSDEIISKARKIIVEHLGVDESKVTPETRFAEDLGADSLDTIEILMAFEDELGVDIPDDEAENVTTVGEAYDLLMAKTAT